MTDQKRLSARISNLVSRERAPLLLAAVALLGDKTSASGGLGSLIRELGQSFEHSNPVLGRSLHDLADHLKESPKSRPDLESDLVEELRQLPLADTLSVATNLAPDFFFGPFEASMDIASTLLEKSRAPWTLIYDGAGMIAWALAKTVPVRLLVTRQELCSFWSAIALAAEAPLEVSQISSSFPLDTNDALAELGEGNHNVFTAPPLGMRVIDGAGRGSSFEYWQLACLSPHCKQVFSTLVSDGFVFRTSKNERTLRQDLALRHRIECIALPTGVYGKWASISTSLLTVYPSSSSGLELIDARELDEQKKSTLSNEIHSDGGRPFLANEGNSKTITIEELSANAFSFHVARYLISEAAATAVDLLDSRHTIRLGDCVNVIRPKAPSRKRKNSKAELSEPQLIVREILPTDIFELNVGNPSKEVAYPESQRGDVRRVQVGGGDVIIALKGKVGVVGVVPNDADEADARDEPWVVSQSLAILRLDRQRSALKPQTLAAILGSPPIEARLKSLVVGTTVPSISMSDLRDLPIPILDEYEADEVIDIMQQIDGCEQEIAAIEAKKSIVRERLWNAIWQSNAELEELTNADR